jgi:hypothetical protein
MQSCQVCGRSFDPLRFQVVVPGLGRGFDRIDCARSARAMASPSSRLAGAPLIALAAPAAAMAPPPAVAATAPVHRLLGSTAATLGLLAAGTAAAALLWVRVVGTDTSSYTLGRLTAPPAFGHDRVQAQVEAAPTPAGPEPVATVTVERVVAVPVPTPGLPALAPAASPRTSPPDRLSRPPTPIARPAQETGKGHPKTGQGHLKHGEDDGVHSPGHGKSQGNGSKPEGTSKAGGRQSHGHGQGKGKGHH